MTLLITGDTHGALRYEYDSPDGFVTRFNRKSFPIQKTLSKEDYVIICGDFGGIFDTDRRYFRESEFEKHHLDWLDTRNFTTLFVPGNHENYDRLIGCQDERFIDSWVYSKMPPEEQRLHQVGIVTLHIHLLFTMGSCCPGWPGQQLFSGYLWL